MAGSDAGRARARIEIGRDDDVGHVRRSKSNRALQRIRNQQARSGGIHGLHLLDVQPQHTVLKVKHPTGVAGICGRKRSLGLLDNVENVKARG
jgi:hypothetical protein